MNKQAFSVKAKLADLLKYIKGKLGRTQVPPPPPPPPIPTPATGQTVADLVGSSGRSLMSTLRNAPKGTLVAGAGLGVGAGALFNILSKKYNESNAKKTERNIELYQALESPLAPEDEIIHDSLGKESAAAGEAGVLLAAGSIPAYMLYDMLRNKKEKDVLSGKRLEVKDLRRAVNKAYREDLMSAYGIEDEQELSDAVSDMRSELNGDMDKESELSHATAGIATAAATLAAFVMANKIAKKTNPNKMQQSRYLDSLDKLYRERTNSPTVRSLPFTDEELLAMELLKQRSTKRPKVVQQEPPASYPIQGEETTMDSPDVENILKEL